MRLPVIAMPVFILCFGFVQNRASVGEPVVVETVFSSQQKKPKQKKTPQKKSTEKSKPTETKTAAKTRQPTSPQKPLEEWDSLDNQRKEIMKELGSIRKKFEISSRTNRIKIRDDYQKLIDRWSKELAPRMTELSFSVWEKKPTEELAKILALESNQFERLAKTIDRMIAAKVGLKSSDRKSIYQLGAEAHFDIHNFQRAKELLAKAEETGSLEFSGVDLKKTVDEYLEFWKTEQALRNKEAQAKEDNKNPRAELVTTKGSIVVELFENQAPNTVKNFIHLAEQKKYDGTMFYHQRFDSPVFGGDLLQKKDPTKNEALGYSIPCECYRDDARMHFRGSLSMILDMFRAKDTGGSAFAILRIPLSFRNPVKEGPNPRGNTVFGNVVSGMDVVDKLTRDDILLEVKVLSKRKHPYIPRTSIDIEKEKKKKATEKKDAAIKDTAKKDTAKKDTAKKDTAKKDTSKKDTSKKDTAKKNTAKKDTKKDS